MLPMQSFLKGSISDSTSLNSSFQIDSNFMLSDIYPFSGHINVFFLFCATKKASAIYILYTAIRGNDKFDI